MTGLKLTAISTAHTDVLSVMHGESFDDGWSPSSIRATLDMPGAFGFIAEDTDGEPLGFGLFRAGGEEAEVIIIATRPQARGQGIAQAVMQNALAQAQAAGALEIFLEVAVDNAPAVKLYQGLGFEEVGRRKGYYAQASGARVDALVLKLSLS